MRVPGPMSTLTGMDRGKTDGNLPLSRLTRNPGLIEWNVDMRVTVSNVRRSKLFQRSRSIVLLLMAIAFAVVLSHLKREIRALQVQMQCVNVNLLVLMSKYDRLNRSLNRAWHRETSSKLQENDDPTAVGNNIRRLIDGASLLGKMAGGNLDQTVYNGSSYAYSTISPVLRPVNSLREKLLSGNGTDYSAEQTVLTIDEPRINVSEGGAIVYHENRAASPRIERAILTFEAQNITQTTTDTSLLSEKAIEDESETREQLPRSARSRRDEGRGKKRGKNKRRPKRSRRRLGPLVATFVGAIPEQHITDTVHVGPWVKSGKTDNQYSFNRFHLVEDKKSIEVTMTGLYMISAQIFYFGESVNYSYWILVTSEGKSTTQRLVKCSTGSSTTATEVSCYTSITTFLRRGDRLHIQQQERDRLINMREGYSYIQLVLLSNNSTKRRVTQR